ncbi:Hypothetical predicted protein [Octopus vulgaris]|uniref:Uncharacterized protein n=1 Tax=Octopus vulgaris TaxID=6645 RepID=A0AA36AQD5_OCTVU|nr:Hypothetical predicted protein [Octopus vulgaris]
MLDRQIKFDSRQWTSRRTYDKQPWHTHTHRLHSTHTHHKDSVTDTHTHMYVCRHTQIGKVFLWKTLDSYGTIFVTKPLPPQKEIKKKLISIKNTSSDKLLSIYVCI